MLSTAASFDTSSVLLSSDDEWSAPDSSPASRRNTIFNSSSKEGRKGIVMSGMSHVKQMRLESRSIRDLLRFLYSQIETRIYSRKNSAIYLFVVFRNRRIDASNNCGRVAQSRAQSHRRRGGREIGFGESLTMWRTGEGVSVDGSAK